jgi:hypothetical protein
MAARYSLPYRSSRLAARAIHRFVARAASRARIVSLGGALVALVVGPAFVGLGACATDTPSVIAASDDGDVGSSDSGASDALAPPDDAGTDDDAAPAVVDGPGAAGATCAFNRDCQAALRCECNEEDGCACADGARGTGKGGVDGCTSGDDCASSVCVDGPPSGGMFCSDECVTSADCTGALPVCTDVAFVGRICIRQAP